jgi:hypothetical protein
MESSSLTPFPPGLSLEKSVLTLDSRPEADVKLVSKSRYVLSSPMLRQTALIPAQLPQCWPGAIASLQIFASRTEHACHRRADHVLCCSVSNPAGTSIPSTDSASRGAKSSLPRRLSCTLCGPRTASISRRCQSVCSITPYGCISGRDGNTRLAYGGAFHDHL